MITNKLYEIFNSIINLKRFSVSLFAEKLLIIIMIHITDYRLENYTGVEITKSILSSYCRNTVFLRIIYTPSESRILVTILPVFCKVNQAVGYTTYSFVWLYIYTFINITWIQTRHCPKFSPPFPRPLLVKNYGSSVANVEITSR